MQGKLWGEKVHEFYSLAGAQALTEAMRRFRGGRLVVHITEMPIKCPVAPMEFTFLADDWLRKHGIRERTELSYVTPLDGAFTKPVASRELATALTDRQITLETDFAAESIDNDAAELVSFDGRRIGFDLLVTVPLNMGADYIARSGLGDELNLVPCDQHTMVSLAHPDIYVLGDAGTLQTSKAGSVAHFAADVFVQNFLAEHRGEPATHGFDGHANCFIESGNRKGMLLDFNYTTEPFTGNFPMPVVGPFKLLKETHLNHLGKLAFRWIYWNMLLPGRPIPMIPTAMSLAGKRVEKQVSAEATGMPSIGAPSSPPPQRTTVAEDLRTRDSRTTVPEELRERTERSVTKGRAPARPKAAPIAKPKAAATPSATKPNPRPWRRLRRPSRRGFDGRPATVLPDPIIPKF